LIDVEAEKARLHKEIVKVEMEVKKCDGKLGNKAFVDKAPAELVEREQARREEWAQKLKQLEEMQASLD
jgi:valyl-tRNA synthetase